MVVRLQVCRRCHIVGPEHQFVVIAGQQGHVLEGGCTACHFYILEGSVLLGSIFTGHHVHTQDTAVDLVAVARLRVAFHRRAACGHRCGKRYCHFLAGGQTEAGLFPLAGDREQCHDCRGDCQEFGFHIIRYLNSRLCWLCSWPQYLLSRGTASVLLLPH